MNETAIVIGMVGTFIATIIAIGTIVYRMGSQGEKLLDIEVLKKKQDFMEREIASLKTDTSKNSDSISSHAEMLTLMNNEHNSTARSLTRLETMMENMLAMIQELKDIRK